MESFSYLSVLVSIVVGLGIAHVLQAGVRIIDRRADTQLYTPSLVWGANLLLLFALVWWSDFSLNGQRHWTFAAYFSSLCVPAALYIASGLVLPARSTEAPFDMRAAYEGNRVWILALNAAAVALSFVQTLLFDGAIRADIDSALKVVLIGCIVLAIVVRDHRVQLAVAVLNLVWILGYIALLFSNLRA